MALNSNHTNKPNDREQLNEVTPTCITSGGQLLDGEDGNLEIRNLDGFIKINTYDRMRVRVRDFSLGSLTDVLLPDGTRDATWIGEVAICIDKDSNVDYIQIDDIEQVMDTSKYIQIATGYFYEGDIFSIESITNCVLGMNTADAFRDLSQAIGRISNLKIRPSREEGKELSIEVYKDEDEELSRFLYGSNSNRSFQEDVDIGRKNQEKKEKLHTPIIEEGLVDRLRNYKKGKITIGTTTQDGQVRILQYNDRRNPIPVPNNLWIVIAIDMEQTDNIVYTGEQQDDSFNAIYEDVTYSSKQEALTSCDLLDTQTENARLGWVIVRGDCTNLSDTNTAEVISTDRFNTQMYDTPFISDQERAKDLEKFLVPPINRTIEIDTTTGLFNASNNRYGHNTWYNIINQEPGRVGTTGSSWDAVTYWHDTPEEEISEIRILLSSGAKTPQIKVNGVSLFLTGENTFTTTIKWYSWRIDKPVQYVQFIVGSGRGDVYMHQILLFYKNGNKQEVKVKQRSDGTFIDELGKEYIFPNNGKLVPIDEKETSEFDVDTILVDDISGDVLTENGNVLINK